MNVYYVRYPKHEYFYNDQLNIFLNAYQEKKHMLLNEIVDVNECVVNQSVYHGGTMAPLCFGIKELFMLIVSH